MIYIVGIHVLLGILNLCCIMIWAGALNLAMNACCDEVLWCTLCFLYTIIIVMLNTNFGHSNNHL